jgi:hypothetical protein
MCSGTRTKPKYIPVHVIGKYLSDDLCNALPGFHDITGCDTTSQFAGHGKKTAWHVFLEDPSLLEKIGKHEPNDTIQSNAEKFAVHLYSRSSVETSINNLPVSMFRHKNPESLSPTKDALQQHVRRAHLQAGVWYAAADSNPESRPPDEFG